MARPLSEEIAECYFHANEARIIAKRAHDPMLKQEFLDMEQRWMRLARGYEFTEELSNFTNEVGRELRRHRSRPVLSEKF
jgi:hypothetical protein